MPEIVPFELEVVSLEYTSAVAYFDSPSDRKVRVFKGRGKANRLIRQPRPERGRWRGIRRSDLGTLAPYFKYPFTPDGLATNAGPLTSAKERKK